MTTDDQKLEPRRPGYLYVLTHPSDPELYKVGVTVLHPEKRMAQHNSQLEKAAGRVVRQTGQLWSLKTYIEVQDPYWAETVFWGATGLADVPGGVTVEVRLMDWKMVEAGLRAVAKAGIRPPPRLRDRPVRDKEWMKNELEGTGIEMVGPYRGLVTGVEFQCQHGHMFKESPGYLAHRKSCPCCVDWGWQRGPKQGLRPSLR